MNLSKFSLILLTALLVVLSLGVSTQEVQAEGRTCYIAREGFEFSAAECENYVNTMVWASTTRGLVNVFLKAIQSSISVTGDNFYVAYNVEQSAQFWTSPFPFDPAFLGLECGMPEIWATRWWVPVGTNLEPGVYTLSFTWTLSHPLTDGAPACSLGEPLGRNIFSGTDQGTYQFTITP